MHEGFTLIETLAALLILAIILPAALESQISVTSAERTARAAEAVAREVDRVLVESICGGAATNGSEAWGFACRIEREPARDKRESGWSGVAETGQAGAARGDMVRWEIVPEDRPSSRITVFARQRP
jgi:prepilin-type N-terminal cleavage/methylation domain-containing protein